MDFSQVNFIQRGAGAVGSENSSSPLLSDDFFCFRHVQLAIRRDFAGIGRDEQLRDFHLLKTRTKRPEPNLVHDLYGFFEPCPITEIMEFHREAIALERAATACKTGILVEFRLTGFPRTFR